MHQAFQPAAAARFHPLELKATHGLLRQLLDEPNNLMGQLRQYVLSYITHYFAPIEHLQYGSRDHFGHRVWTRCAAEE